MTYDSISALTAVKATLPHLSFSAKKASYKLFGAAFSKFWDTKYQMIENIDFQ